MKPVWQSGVNGSSVTVAMVDDGLEHSHKDISDNYVITIYIYIGKKEKQKRKKKEKRKKRKEKKREKEKKRKRKLNKPK